MFGIPSQLKTATLILFVLVACRPNPYIWSVREWHVCSWFSGGGGGGMLLWLGLEGLVLGLLCEGERRVGEEEAEGRALRLGGESETACLLCWFWKGEGPLRSHDFL